MRDTLMHTGQPPDPRMLAVYALALVLALIVLAVARA